MLVYNLLQEDTRK